MRDNLRIAVAQSPGTLEGPQERVDWLEKTLTEHCATGADLLLLPELFLTGYHAPNMIEHFAEALHGPLTAQIADLAQRFKIALHFGYAERVGDRLYNSAACFGADGKLLGHHRKLLLPPGFEADHFQAGEACSLLALKGFNVATLICYDVEFPESFRHVVENGADVVLVPTALSEQWGVVSQCLIPTRAFENGTYVCYANHCGEENGLTYFGGSCIAGPTGEELARAGRDETVLIVDLDLSKVTQARERLPYHVDRHKLPWIGT